MHKPVPVEEQSPDRSLWWEGPWAPGGHPAWHLARMGLLQTGITLAMALSPHGLASSDPQFVPSALLSLQTLVLCSDFRGGKCSCAFSHWNIRSVLDFVPLEVLCFGRCLSQLLFSVAFVESKEKYFNWSNRNASRTGHRYSHILEPAQHLCSAGCAWKCYQEHGKAEGGWSWTFWVLKGLEIIM